MKRWQFALQQPEIRQLMDLDLKGRSVLISGASKGIGRAVAEEFAREGCSLYLVSRTAADLERARDEIRARHNVPVEIHAADLARPEARQAVVEKAGAIDILINNAGAIPKGDLLELDDARWREAWDLKVFGYINMCRDYYRAHAGAQVRRHHQHHRPLVRETRLRLSRRLDRQCRAGGVHPRARQPRASNTACACSA